MKKGKSYKRYELPKIEKKNKYKQQLQPSRDKFSNNINRYTSFKYRKNNDYYKTTKETQKSTTNQAQRRAKPKHLDFAQPKNPIKEAFDEPAPRRLKGISNVSFREHSIP